MSGGYYVALARRIRAFILFLDGLNLKRESLMIENRENFNLNRLKIYLTIRMYRTGSAGDIPDAEKSLVHNGDIGE